MILKRYIFRAILAAAILPLVNVAALDEEIKRASDKYGFLGPEIVKIGENMRNLQPGDFDNDGRVDFMAINPTDKKVYVYYQSKESSLQFEPESFIMDKNTSNILTGDIDGDGRIDLIFLDDKNKVNVRFHESEKRAFSQSVEIELDGKNGSLKLGELNNDARPEIAVMNEDSLYILFCDKGRSFQKPKKYENTLKKIVNFYFSDIDGDGLKDLVMFDPSTQTVTFRKQRPDANFSQAITQKIEGFNPDSFSDINGDKRDEIIGLNPQTNALKAYRFLAPGESVRSDKTEPAAGNTKFRLSAIRDYQLRGSGNASMNMAIGDVNGDKRLDLVCSVSSQSEINLYLQDKNGELKEKQSFPSFTGIKSVAVGDIDNDKKQEVVVLSQPEKSIGIMEMTAEGRLSFPSTVKTEHVPTSFILTDINNDGRTDLVYGAQDEKGEQGFIFIKLQDEKGVLVDFEKIELTSKQGTMIEEIKALDLNNDKFNDLVVFFMIGSPVVFLSQEGAKFKDITAEDQSLKNVLNKLSAIQITSDDINRDGIKELIVSRNNFARSLVWQSDNKMQLLDQYNGKSPDSNIQAAFLLDLDKDNIPEIILYDSQQKLLTIMKKGEQLYEIAENIDVGYFTLKKIFTEDVNNDGVKDIILFGQERFGIIYSGVTDPRFESCAEYTTKIKRGYYTKFEIGDVNNDGKKDVVLVEAKRHNLEILSFDKKCNLKQELTFQIFEDPAIDMMDEEKDDYRWRNLSIHEPREIKIIDINGDKKEDILIVAHRNLLIYIQE